MVAVSRADPFCNVFVANKRMLYCMNPPVARIGLLRPPVWHEVVAIEGEGLAPGNVDDMRTRMGKYVRITNLVAKIVCHV